MQANARRERHAVERERRALLARKIIIAFVLILKICRLSFFHQSDHLTSPQITYTL